MDDGLGGAGGDAMTSIKDRETMSSEQQWSSRLVETLRSLLEREDWGGDVGSSVLQDNHDGIW